MDILNIPQDASVYDILRGIMLDDRVNFVRVSYGGKAAQPILAWFRCETGETRGDEGISHMILDKFVSNSRGNLNLTLAFDRSAREIDASDPMNWIRFGVRSRTIGNVDGELNVETISINLRGRAGWIEIDLRNRNIFPQPHDADKFLELEQELAQLRANLDVVNGDITSIKGKAKRRGVNKIENGGNIAEVLPPDGKVFAIVDGDGNRISADYPTETNCISLSLADGVPPNITSTREIDDLPSRMILAEQIRQRIKEIVNIVRPIELGLIERHRDLEKFKLRGMKFVVNRWTTKDYGYSPETQTKVDAGEYRVAEVDKSRSQWTLRKAAPEGFEIENIEENIPQPQNA